MPLSNTQQAVKMAMASKGIKGKDLAKLMGVEPTTVSRWRTKGCDSLRDLTRIAGYCDLTIDEMMELGK